MQQVRVIMSTGLDPWKNLAIEEYLVQYPKEDTVTLFLWKNDKTVVVGKHQNPWRECNIPLLEEDKVKLARRMTGGGAVYHGLGNINFSFIVPNELYDVHRQMRVILTMCKELGIEGELTGRNDLTVEGKKFSGNAFYHGPSVSLHHGTLLVNENMANLGKYLTVSKAKMESKGVKSVKSRVTNLGSFFEGLDTDKVAKACIHSFLTMYNPGGENVPVERDPQWFDNEIIAKIREKHASWAWQYGRNTKFQILHEVRFPWGEVQLHLNVKEGVIREAMVYSDTLLQDVMDGLLDVFVGERYTSKELGKKLGEYTIHEEGRGMIEDMSDWILELGF